MKNKINSKIALILFGITISTPIINTVYAMESSIISKQYNNKTSDFYNEKLIENIELEGISYQYKYYYNENGERCISITDMNTSKTDILVYGEKDASIYLDGKKIGDVKTYYNSEKDLNNSKAVDTSWKLMGIPVHHYISWAKGTSTSIVLGLISVKLGLSSKYVLSALSNSLSTLAGQSVGGTLHYSNYYRDLAFGQVQYRTDWSFVASNGDRYGTYTYLSTPM